MTKSPWNAIAGFIAAALICIYFFEMSRLSIHTGFSHDDLMNTYLAWREPWSDVLLSNLFVPTKVIRPFGALFYVTLFDRFGFDPVPFRLVCYIALWFNVFLMFVVGRYLTGRYEVALLLTFLHCHRSEFFPFYYGSGYCYDIFAFAFYFSALAIYVRARSKGKTLRSYELAVIAILYACAVNAKEAAASLPAIFLAYELIFNPPKSGRYVVTWLKHEGRGFIATGLVGVAFVWARFTGPNNLLNHPAYTPLFTLGRYLESTATYLNDLVVRPAFFSPASAGYLLLALLAVAALTRNRLLLFAWILIVAGSAPIAFVQPRGLASYYIPTFGYSLYAGILLVRLGDLLTRTSRRVPALVWHSAVFLAIFVTVVPFERKHAAVYRESYWDEWKRIQLTADYYKAHPEWFGPAKSMLIVNDPLQGGNWDSAFIAYLIGGHRSMHVQKLSEMNPKPTPEEIATYSTIIAFRDGRYVSLKPDEVVDPERISPGAERISH
ncbi:MAG TPA: hypothetical protein VEX68_24440 [Bryobacteraceae bacterium]|nr:hypothetical protein [Bryobacteraceae bacterium]